MQCTFPRMNKTLDDKETLSIKLMGKRIFKDQTLSEYLLEFLLIFVSAKDKDGSGELEFHTPAQLERSISYYAPARVGLKRFIFYDRSKRDSRSDIDTAAYNEIMTMLQERSDDPDYPYMLQDLLYGYSLVIKNRGWYAQSLLPVAPDLIFPEALGINKRKMMDETQTSNLERESEFQFGQHDFMARGGEMYYLHLLQGLCEHKDGECYRRVIEKGIRHMLTSNSAGFSLIANCIQKWWYEKQELNLTDEKVKAKLIRGMNLGYIQPGFDRRSVYSLQELATFLMSELHPITRIELLSNGIMLALLRAMHLQAFYYSNEEGTPPPTWVIDMRAGSATSNVGKLAAESYRNAYTSFSIALNEMYEATMGANPQERHSTVNKEMAHNADVFKRMGKEIQFVIPPRGGYERFSLSENLIRYLVLSIVGPGHKLTLDTFLERLYQHFGMVIGPSENLCSGGNPGMTSYFEENKKQFQAFLKNCGLLHDLSDATSIVENPYAEVSYE